MQTRINFLVSALLLAGTIHGFGQPTISSVKLSGHAQTAGDTYHPYANPSASLGADVTLTVTASGTGSLGYQWQFQDTNLPDQTNAALRFPSLQLTNAGDYTVVITDSSGSNSQVTTLTVDATFTKITTGPVVTDPGDSYGGTFGDYNIDGFPDLFVFNGFNGAALPYLYRNNGDGTFTKVTSGPPVNVASEASSALWFDYDDDGNLDLYVATSARNLLFHNNGDGTFSRILTGSPVTDNAATLAAAAADYNLDGFLDLFVATFDPDANSHCFLYRNNGNGTFTSVANNILATDLASSVGCAWADYNNDGLPDLFVTGGRGAGSPLAPNRLYRNNGDGTFTRITTGSIVTDLGYCGTCVWGDFGNSGFFDLFVNNSFGRTNLSYHNNGDDTFTRIINDIVATDVAPAGNNNGGSFGCAAGDYDNDGFLDLVVANRGDSSITPAAVNFLYCNNGDGTFTKVTLGSLGNEYSDSIGCVWEDYDNDGFLDLFVAREGGRGNYLYHNNRNTNSWLTIRLIGTASNCSAIGAKVRVKASYRGASRWQLRQITGGSGYAGHNELRANFGLGDATNVDLVRIEWPSGIVQTVTNVAPKQILTVVEHQQPGASHPPAFADVSGSPSGAVNLSVAGDTGLLYVLEASTNLVNWTKVGVSSNATGIVSFSDTKATNYTGRCYRALIP